MNHSDVKKQIQKWKEEKLISADQAAKMLADVSAQSNEQRASNMIVSLSTIGAVLVGLGAILFIASNWNEMNNFTKTCVLLGSTAVSYVGGYILQYQRANYPKVGAALLFLGALLFGASVFLIAQMYHVNAHNHLLLLLWLAGVAPLAYGFRSLPTAVLSLTIFFVWIGFFLLRGQQFDEDMLFFFPVIYSLAGMLVLALGSIHYLNPNFDAIGRIWQIAGLKVSMISLFLLTFDIFHSGWYGGAGGSVPQLFGQFSARITVVLLLAAAIITLGAVIALNPHRRATNALEHGVVFIPIASILLYLYVPALGPYALFLFNILFIGLSLFLLLFGYSHEDMQLVNTGILWISAFILAKYFDWFWSLFDRSLFFIVGGVLLVFGGLAIERKRRDMKQHFAPVT